jgi:CheY-like chemotaxis protein
MPTALVVDDSALDRRIAGQCVEENGLTAVYAENGALPGKHSSAFSRILS